MRSRKGVLLAGVLLASGAWAAAPDPAQTLLARTLAPTAILDDLQELVDGIGGRPTGTAALDRAVEFGLAKFTAAGLEKVHAESYVAPRIWVPGVDHGEIIVPRQPWEPEGAWTIRVAAMPFSASTADSGLEADIVDVGTGDEAGFAAAGPRAKGHWALVNTEPMRGIEDLFKEYMATPGTLERARQAGVAGVLWMSNRPGRLLYRHNASLDGSAFPLPGAVIEREAAERLARAVALGQPARVRLILGGHNVANAPARNVVAEIRGRMLPEETVILGAHLDSWDLGRGALDNGCNAALVIDVARQAMSLAREGIRPRRTLRFVLYTGEEAGLWGSYGEVRNHRADLDHVKAQVIFDIGTGRTTGFSLGGRADLKAATDSALAPAAALGPFSQTLDAFIGTDNYDYLVEGVPTLVANQDAAPYLPPYHAESDTFDKVDSRELKVNAAIAAVLTFGLADAEAAPAPRQSRKEIEALAKATGLDEQMKIFGLWDPFTKGDRGRQPDSIPPRPVKR